MLSFSGGSDARVAVSRTATEGNASSAGDSAGAAGGGEADKVMAGAGCVTCVDGAGIAGGREAATVGGVGGGAVEGAAAEGVATIATG